MDVSRNRVISSVGKPLKNTKIEIVNKGDNGFGEIIISGDGVMQGYFDMWSQQQQLYEIIIYIQEILDS